MSGQSLPPYSTFRTDSKQMMFPQATSHGNILTFTPPGFTQELSVKFPDSRLAVCQKCKKNFKTRDMCRVRNTHTDSPWTTAYVCITIDDSCLDQNGQFVDKPLTVRMVQWQPYCVMKPFHKKTPVCAACKRTNRTRNFCRERHKHRALPWCTVYVLLSALDSADPNTVVAGASRKVPDGDVKPNIGAGEDSSPGDESSRATDTNSVAGDTIASDSGDPGDDIHDIADSRTFLAKVSCRATSIHWLEMADFDPGEGNATFSPTPPEPQYTQPAMDHMAVAASHQYYQPNMNFAAQQHQNALKSRQQYFFQMQQQQQQQQQFLIPGGAAMPSGSAPIQWAQGTQTIPPYHLGPSGQMEQSLVGDDETLNANNHDATAAASAQAHQPQHLQHTPSPMTQQHWATMYYQAPPNFTTPHVTHEVNGRDGHSHAEDESSAPPAVNGVAKDDPSEEASEGHEQSHKRPDDAHADNDEQNGHESKKQRVD